MFDIPYDRLEKLLQKKLWYKYGGSPELRLAQARYYQALPDIEGELQSAHAQYYRMLAPAEARLREAQARAQEFDIESRKIDPGLWGRFMELIYKPLLTRLGLVGSETEEDFNYETALPGTSFKAPRNPLGDIFGRRGIW